MKLSAELKPILNWQPKPIFCGCTTEFGGSPTPIAACLHGSAGIPSHLNQKVVEYAIKAGLALNCKINTKSHMDRKNYVYPDLPKAYQISQYDEPLCEKGYIELDSGKRIGLPAFISRKMPESSSMRTVYLY